MSNGTVVVMEEDVANNFVVFNVYDDTGKNRVIALSVVDPDTIAVSTISASNSLQGYKEEHDRMKVLMKKQ